ncbi:unnamed protein product [Blepharisma stoltei]|uniref:Large ribosomal subunit protein uL4m n=1 Tax=Blepharisma stoltei TaxID=1481888 RepID=A0AAU9IPB9_9CILI|nr:unnamed protein product [Blepharisma stoltei]
MLVRFRCFSTWALPALGTEASLTFPVVFFKTAQPTKQTVTLDPTIFNVPVRRDIIHNVFHYYRCLNWQTTHRSRRVGEMAGPGAKIRGQKKSGRARVGKLQANLFQGGAKSHGPVPRDHSFVMNSKVKLLALKCLLSARLAEGNITFVDNILKEAEKTKEVAPYPKLFGERVILLHGPELPAGFVFASRNIKGFKVLSTEEVILNDIVLNPKLLITVDGLNALQNKIKGMESALFRNRKLNRKLKEESKAEEEIQPVVIKSKMLKDIVQKYNLDIPTN